MRRRRSGKYWPHWILCLAVVAAGVVTARSGLAQTSSGSWSSVASMLTTRAHLAAATGSDGRIYAIGGAGRRPRYSTVEAYDPKTNAWSTVAPMPTARAELAAAMGPDGRIYAIGGGSSRAILKTVEAYAPAVPPTATPTTVPSATPAPALTITPTPR
jgi:hypothetical protein